eukprot:gnl/Dysnectes_brevis/1758_a2005_511.p1 GENE.gnl/Dysnectes_brevis/1758_a2005_511~~gnl/Dysnectes_brevis/1758_a2005_511.p1  ORF type:complete len:767 (-),score=271.80 gnl/Dysnectes_brevis/1758_a2005_511:232-2532(-)
MFPQVSHFVISTHSMSSQEHENCAAHPISIPEFPIPGALPIVIPQAMEVHGGNESTIDSMLRCESCLNTMIQPILVNPCGHVICRQCFNRGITKRARRCAFCQQPFTAATVIDRLQKAVRDTIMFHCPCQDKGCSFTGLLPDIVTHMDTCNWRPRVCPNKKHGCRFDLTTTDLPLRKHLHGGQDTPQDQICQHHKIPCPACQQPQARHHIAVHADICPQRSERCPRCEWVGAAHRLPIHLLKCPGIEVSCLATELGCTWSGRSDQLQHHLQSCVFRERALPCIHCQKQVTLTELTGHLLTCGHRTAHCPKGCGWIGMRGTLGLHLSRPCPVISSTPPTPTYGSGASRRASRLSSLRKKMGAIADGTSKVKRSERSKTQAQGQSMVPCANSPQCAWSGTVEELRYHLRDCSFQPMPCPFMGRGCHARPVRQDFLVHIRENCRFRPASCPHCSTDLSHWQLEDHVKNCPQRSISCRFASNGCGWSGLQKDSKLHLESCAYRLTPEDREMAAQAQRFFCSYRCGFVGCPSEVESHELECKRAKVFNLLQMMEEQKYLEDRTPPLIVCPLVGCDCKISAKHLALHMSDPAFSGRHLQGMRARFQGTVPRSELNHLQEYVERLTDQLSLRSLQVLELKKQVIGLSAQLKNMVPPPMPRIDLTEFERLDAARNERVLSSFARAVRQPTPSAVEDINAPLPLHIHRRTLLQDPLPPAHPRVGPADQGEGARGVQQVPGQHPQRVGPPRTTPSAHSPEEARQRHRVPASCHSRR